MLADNLRAVVGRACAPERARLPGYTRYRVGRECLPGIRALQDGAVEGIVYRDLSASEVTVLDGRLGSDFAPATVRLVIGGAEIITAETAVLVEGYTGQLAREPWDFDLLMRIFSQADTELGTGAILLSRLRAC